jgi:metal-sulfur cluster biosynthetic enzyme
MNDPDVLEALRSVNDPELGINIVDLGLVYRAERGPGGIEVALTLSSPSCPLGEVMLQDVRDALSAHFGGQIPVQAALVWEPPWSPERMSADAKRRFG